MNRSRFIQGLKGDIQLSEKERRRIIRKSLQKYSWKTKCTVAMEEFAELQQQVSKQVREKGGKVFSCKGFEKRMKYFMYIDGKEGSTK